MLAAVQKVNDRYIARFDRLLHHPLQEVWAALTQNEKLEKWMPNLKIAGLRSGGMIQFNMNDGTGASFAIKITDCRENPVLEFEWGDGRVRFELYPEADGCLLVLKESLPAINEHTAKDLAGWHVCLDMLIDLLNEHVHADFPKENWEKRHTEYAALIEQVK